MRASTASLAATAPAPLPSIRTAAAAFANRAAGSGAAPSREREEQRGGVDVARAEVLDRLAERGDRHGKRAPARQAQLVRPRFGGDDDERARSRRPGEQRRAGLALAVVQHDRVAAAGDGQRLPVGRAESDLLARLRPGPGEALRGEADEARVRPSMCSGSPARPARGAGWSSGPRCRPASARPRRAGAGRAPGRSRRSAASWSARQAARAARARRSRARAARGSPGDALRHDQRARPEPGGLQGAVERAAAGSARAVAHLVDRHMPDGRVVEVQVSSRSVGPRVAPLAGARAGWCAARRRCIRTPNRIGAPTVVAARGR